jgi:hypothetical protein
MRAGVAEVVGEASPCGLAAAMRRNLSAKAACSAVGCVGTDDLL